MVFKIAVVGLGKIATDQHLPCIAKNADFKLVAGVSRHAKVDNVPCFESLGELISSGMAIDCVALCTPPSVRLAMARQALDAGYHVLIEKPPTPTLGEMFAMIDYAESQEAACSMLPGIRATTRPSMKPKRGSRASTFQN